MSVQAITSTLAYPVYRGATAGNAHARQAAIAPGSLPVPLPENIPVERVIEGELLEKKTSGSGTRPGDFMARFFLSGNYNSQGQDARPQSSVAIAAYLSNGRPDSVDATGVRQRVDLYV